MNREELAKELAELSKTKCYISNVGMVIKALQPYLDQQVKEAVDAAVKAERERIARLLRAHLTLTSENRLELSAEEGQEIFALIVEKSTEEEK